MSEVYTRAFYDAGRSGMQRSAREIVPYLHSLLAPRSVIDVGCGEGWWLKEFEALGVEHLFGVEGNVERIESGVLVKHDLETPMPLSETFDLCLCLETAEHLSPERASGFVRELCHLSDTVVFSAAIPKQGGNAHLNEQWPSYWISEFSAWGFAASDMLRRAFWENEKVEVWYRQNIILFSRDGRFAFQRDHPLDIVHPRLWGYYRGINS